MIQTKSNSGGVSEIELLDFINKTREGKFTKIDNALLKYKRIEYKRIDTDKPIHLFKTVGSL